MALSVPSYLRLSRHNVFYFRWPIPAALHPRGKVQHVETSLRTRNPRLALQMARYLAYHAENITGRLVGMTHAEIKEELRAFFAKWLENRKRTMDEHGVLPPEQVSYYENTLFELELAIERGDDDFTVDESLDDELQRILRVRKLNIQQDTPEYGHLKREYKFAHAQYCRDVLTYNKGIRSYDLSPVRVLTQQPTENSGITLKQAVADFILERQRGEAWTPRTLKDRTAQLALLCEILGDNIDISSVNVHKVDTVIKILHDLPKNRNKNPKTKGLTLNQMLVVTEAEKLDARTVNEYITVYQSLFAWAERRGYIIKNFFEGRQIKLGKRKANARVPFTSSQIKTILAALPAHTQEKSGKSFRYWGVMLAIYTGARLNEIAQLALGDIQQADGIWYLNITDEGDDDNKRLKNESSKRRVPVHAALLAAGFIDRVQELRDAGHNRLFPDLEYQQGHGYGRGLTRWVSTKLLVDLGIKDEGLSFHSFRHSFITGLRQAGVELQTVQELVGHSKDVVTETVYNATAYPLPMLKTAIDRLFYT
ncbi:MAG TPA: site-specific integrase [Alphaproteobacteria bacterium]|nr:site-specific integrase [Alphaproteobacteria bacterium]